MGGKNTMKSAFLLCLTTLSCVAALAQAPAPLSPPQVEAYANIGRVWGFLKYYHPAVGSKTYNWDSVLVAALPRDSSVMSAEIGLQVVDRLLEVAGPVPDCQVCPPEFDSAQAVNVDWGWMEKNALLRSDQMAQLQRMRDQREPGENGYIGEMFEDRDLPLYKKFLMDAAYDDIDHFDHRHRLMTLFHYWQVIESFFPYKHTANPDWDATLREAVPRFVQAHGVPQFQLAMLWIANQINDSHANASYSPHILAHWYGRYRFPFELRVVDDRAVVVNAFLSDSLKTQSKVQIGDRVVAIDGQEIWAHLRQRGEYIGASHPAAKERYMLLYAITGIQPRATLTLVRAGDTLQLIVDRYLIDRLPARQMRQRTWERVGAGQDFLLIRAAQLESSSEARRLMRKAKRAQGMIIDLRAYGLWSNGFMTMFEHLQPAEATFTMHASGRYDYPGFLEIPWPQALGEGNQRGQTLQQKPVVLLIGNNVLSNDEYMIMHLQAHPHTYHLGSPTGGALGPIGRIDMPGGFQAHFTQHGVTYADGTPIFGRGVKLDETVLPTRADIRAGRDPVLERAIEYLHEVTAPVGDQP